MFFPKSKSSSEDVQEPREVEIQLDHPDGVYAPGETVSVELSWRSSVSIRSIELTLAWSTEGKGDTNSDIVVEQRWDDLVSKTSLEWSFVMPRGPLSLNGQLVSIYWNLECAVEFEGSSRDENHGIPIQLSLGPNPIALSRVEAVANFMRIQSE